MTVMGFFRKKSIAFFMAFLMVYPQLASGVVAAVSPTVENRPGAIKTGKVDMASGNLAFSENIFSLKGYKLTLKYNTEGISEDVKSINGDKTTGVVGLGWKLAKDRIVRLTHQTANTVDDEYLLNAHGKVSKLTFEGEVGDTLHFRLPSNPYWRILFLENNDQWIVQKDNGKKYIYGDGDLIDFESRSTEKGIKWDNWIGSSIVSDNQSQLSVAWNLSAIDNHVGERVRLSYSQVSENVGGNGSAGLLYTQATYLKKVVGMDGNYISLNYNEKDALEYEDPHVENTLADEQRTHAVLGPDQNGDNDAFQERFETKFLRDVTRSSFADVIDRKVQFDYSFIGEGNLRKRILSEIEYLNKNNSIYEPSKKYDYYGEDDGVRVGETSDNTNIFSSATSALYGAIKSITIPGGGSYIYKYDEVQIAGSSLTFDIPFPTDVNYTDEVNNDVTVGWLAPKLFFMNDYVVVIHEINAHDRKLSNIGTCTWIGDRWEYQDFGNFEGLYYDRYHNEAYHEKNMINTIKTSLLSGLSSRAPIVGGLMNAFNDAISDDIANLYTEVEDLARGDVGAAIRDYFKGEFKIMEDIVLDIIAALETEFENYEYNIQDLLGIRTHESSEQQLVNDHADYISKNPRKKYHIALQKDFFSIASAQGELQDGNVNQAVHIFEKDPLVQGKWDRFSKPIRVTSKYFDLHAGNEFVTVFDECSDGMFTFTKDSYLDWKGSFFRINQVLSDEEVTNVSAITAGIDVGIQEAFGSMSDVDKEYLNMLSVNKRSTIAARNNFIIVTTSEADGANARIQMFHHNKNNVWNWRSPAEVRFDKTLIPIDVAQGLQALSDGLGLNSVLELKTGNSIAALQVYDNLNMEALNDILEVTTGGVGATDGSTDPINPLSTIQSDFLQDMSAMNATYGIVWNEDMTNIDVQLLHASIGQTGIKTYINGNVIQKIGKAYSLLVGSHDDNGMNYAFRYDGEKFVTSKFASQYFTSAMAPDVASQMIESADKAYKTPVFSQYNANRPVTLGPTQSVQGTATITDGNVDRFGSGHILANVPSQLPWSTVENASQEQIASPEFVKEAIHVSTDLLNLVIQVIMMLIPFAGEFAIAEKFISIVDKVTQIAGLAAMAIQPAGDALVDKILGVNHKSTSIANNYLSTNGKLFARTPDGTWSELGRAFELGTDDKLVGLNNELSNGYYNYTVKRSAPFSDELNSNIPTNIQNYVTILKNRGIYETIPLNQYVDGNLLVIRKDSVTVTGGGGAFVAYGPANNDGYVVTNPDIVRTEAQNADERRRKQSYDDATIIRLHKIADEKVTGSLVDYVVSSVETNTGVESTYMHYSYDNATAVYNAGHGAAIYPKVTVYPSKDSNLGDNHPFGGYSYYFYNSENYVDAIGGSHGFAETADDLTDEDLISFSGFDYRSVEDFASSPINTLMGRQYMMEIFDANSQVISRTIDCHQLFEHDFFYRTSDLELDKVYQAFSSVKIKMTDGVSTKVVNRYTDEYRATLPRTVEHHSTSVTGEPEIRYTSKTYAFEHYPALWDQNRLHEVSFTVDSVRQGNDVYILDATVVAYEPQSFTNVDGDVWMPKDTYKADGVRDIANPNTINYQAAAATEVALMDRDIAVYDAIVAAYEAKIGNYHLSFEAAIGANKAAVNSLNQVSEVSHEIVNTHTNLELSLSSLDQSNQDLTNANQIVTEHRNALNATTALYNISKVTTTEAYGTWQQAVKDKQGAVVLATVLGGVLIGLPIAEGIWTPKVNNAYSAYQSALASEDALKKVMETDRMELLSVISHLNSLAAQHTAVANAVSASKLALLNAMNLLVSAEDSSQEAIAASSAAINISSVKNTDLTSHAHTSAVAFHDVSVGNHQSFVEVAQGVIRSLQNIESVISNTDNPEIYASVRTNASLTIDAVNLSIEKHNAHITNVNNTKDQHLAVVNDISLIDVAATDIKQFDGRDYNWYQVSSVLQRDSRTGIPISSADPKGVISSHLLDANSRFVIASVTDADLNNNEAFYSGFEVYEKDSEFTSTSFNQIATLGNGGSTSYNDEYAHTGERSLQVTQGSAKIYPQLFNANPNFFYADTAYVVSAFVKVTDNARVWVGADSLQFENAKVESKNDLENTDWQYIEGVVIGEDLNDEQKPTLHVSDVYGQAVYIDDITVRPLSSNFEATVYNDISLPIAKIDNNGLTKHLFYDSHNRLQTVVDDRGRIYGMNLASFSREFADNDAFDTENPNEATSFSFINYGEIIEPEFFGQGSGTISTSTNDALISFSIEPIARELVNVNLNIGSISFGTRGENIFVNSGSSVETIALDGIAEDWTIAKIDDMLYLWVNGKCIEQIVLSESQSSEDLSMNYSVTNSRIKNVVVGKQPLFKVDYTNGIGQHLQTMRPHFDADDNLIGFIRRGSLYDGWGHKAVSTLPMYSESKEMSYSPSFITSFNWDTGVMEGDVSDYYASNSRIIKHSSDHKYPYSRTFFENYPITRAVKKLKPGHEFHAVVDAPSVRIPSPIGSTSAVDSPFVDERVGFVSIPSFDFENAVTSNETLIEYQDSVSALLLAQFGLDNSNFKTTKKTSSLGHENIEVKDKMGRKVLSKKGDAISKNVNTYTDSGFVVDSVFAPNHFDASKNTSGSMFASSHANEGLLNLKSVNSSPDRGRVELIKDQKGKNVFIKTASSTATASRVGEVKYYVYDEQDRVIEQGIYFTTWDTERLNTLAKAPFWYDTDREMVKTYRYDMDENLSSLNNKGRITKTVHQTDAGMVESRFEYNIYGQITSNHLTILGKGFNVINSSSVNYEYYPSGQVQKITYPNDFKVVYSFNRSAKIKAIGTPDDLDLYATYLFDDLDRIKSQSRDNGQYSSNITYDFRGRQQVTSWQNNARDTIFKQELNFFNAGRYYDTKISSIKYSGSMYTNIQRDYEYDSQDRMVQANVVMNQNTPLSTSSTANYEYDKNSNLERYTNTASPGIELDYFAGTNQDLVEGSNAYDADGLKIRFNSNAWGNQSQIEYSNYTHKPEVIHRSDFDVINPAKWYKISSSNFADAVLSVKNSNIVEAESGDKLTVDNFFDSDHQYFKFEKVSTNNYRIRSKANLDLSLSYDVINGFNFAEPSPTASDKFAIEAITGQKGSYRILPLAYANKRLTIVSQNGNLEVGIENTTRTSSTAVSDNAGFKLLAGENTSPSNEFVAFNYDAKNNRVMKVRDLTSSDQVLKQDTLLYIHGNNRLPLSEILYGTETDSEGNETDVNKISNYIYGPGFGALGIRVFDMRTIEGTETLTPTDDAFTRNNTSGTNYGSSTRIAVKLDGSWTRFGFLKFDVSGFEGATITSVKLKLTPTQWIGNEALNTPFRVSSIRDDRWSEDWISFQSMPYFTNAVALDVQTGSNEAMEWDVTEQFISDNNGDGVMSLFIDALRSHSDGYISFHSKESDNVAGRPQLVIEYSTPVVED